MKKSRTAIPVAGARRGAIAGNSATVRNLARALSVGVAIAFAAPACTVEQADDAAAGGDDAGTTIVYRQFSAGPSLGRGQGSSDPQSSDYGALAIFTERVEARTGALGPDRQVRFSLAEGSAALGGVDDDSYEAAHVAGGELNEVWGFVYNSVPFGPTFSQMIDFLHDGDGVALANRIFRERDVDVVAFPVVGSPAQGSGYFQKPVGTPECPPDDEACARYGDGIGLSGLCSEPWTLRYLPPPQLIVDRACDTFDSPQRLEFIQAVPGGSALLPAVQQGTVDGFEFATPLDDYDAASGGFFANAGAPEGSDGRNAAEVGLRYLHYPAWHQPFFLGWMVINRSQVWDRLDADQQEAIESAAREAVVESFEATGSVACEALRRILAINNGGNQRRANGDVLDASADIVPTRWRTEDLDRLRSTTLQLLESRGGGSSPTGAEADFRTIVTALHEHLGYASVAEMLGAWTEPDSPAPGNCVLPAV